MTMMEAVVITVSWYVLWGVLGYVNGHWYTRRLLTVTAPARGLSQTTMTSLLAFAYAFASIAPLLYPPFLDAVTQSSPLFYSLPATIALSLLPTLLKFHAANEIAERHKRGKRNLANVTQLPVALEQRQRKAG